MGAGAAGLMAASRAGQLLRGSGSSDILLVEGNPKPGKKLLATGNGRCNLTNLSLSAKRYHGDVKAAQALLSAYPPGRILAEYKRMGLLCRTDSEGRAYPNSLQAAAVLQTLWSSCEEVGVKILCGFETVSILAGKNGFLLTGRDGRTALAEKCVLACGGMAAPKHSCGEKGYGLAKSLGHSVTDLAPSLAPLKTTAKFCRPLKGMRCRARAALYRKGKEIAAESGEVLFGDGQLSGICVLNLSSWVRGEAGSEWEVGLDLLEGMELPALCAYLKQICKDHPALPSSNLFSGALNLRVGQELVKSLKIPADTLFSGLSPETLERAARAAKDLRFPVTASNTWDSAQVTAGGVPLCEVDIKTMESRKRPGLYLAGEMLNVDGDCGGFNLHWAWATGMAAGSAAAGKAG